MKRRTLLLSGTGLLGALVVGWSVLPARSRMGAASLMTAEGGDIALNGWIKITADGGAVLAMARSEMGQGVHTALPMLVAEELDLPLSRVRIEQAGSDAIYGNIAALVASLPFHPLDAQEGHKTITVRLGEWIVGKVARELGLNVTGGSSSVSDAWEPLRLAAATARASLLAAAAMQWKVPVDELTVQAGMIHHASGKKGHYGEWAQAAARTPPGAVRLKERKDWKLIGSSAQRLDVPAKTNGTAQYGLDVRLPGMLYAAVRMCPMLGGAPAVVQPDAALAMQGVVRLVMLPAYAGSTAGFAVVGKTWWHAQQGAQAVDVHWQQRPLGALDSAQIEVALTQAAQSGEAHAFYSKGEPEGAVAKSGRKIEAVYSAPFLAHATLEPMNCTAQVSAGKVEIWAPTQVPQAAREIAARVAGVALDRVILHVTLLGGGFGRRLEVDSVAQAVRIAMDCAGKPVQLIWSREEDMTHDFYRPMHVAVLSCNLDDKNQVQALRIQSAGDAITPRQLERAVPKLAGPVDMPDKTTSEGLFDLPYDIPHQHMAHVATRMGVPVGFWRSVGHSHNAFFSESFIDEMAATLHADSLELRLRLLKHAPRYLTVLNLAADKAQWDSKLPLGRARGVALHESFGSVVAHVVEASVVKNKPVVHRVICAIDCGTVVNPQIVAQQVESSVVFALSAALYGRIDIKGGVVSQSNFSSYTMLKLAETPHVQVHIVPSTLPPTGVGEPAVPPLAPAVANAVFALTGKRLRTLPLQLA